jgi:hypothetical protein
MSMERTDLVRFRELIDRNRELEQALLEAQAEMAGVAQWLEKVKGGDVVAVNQLRVARRRALSVLGREDEA